MFLLGLLELAEVHPEQAYQLLASQHVEEKLRCHLVESEGERGFQVYAALSQCRRLLGIPEHDETSEEEDNWIPTRIAQALKTRVTKTKRKEILADPVLRQWLIDHTSTSAHCDKGKRGGCSRCQALWRLMQKAQ